MKEIHQSDSYLLDDLNGRKRQTYYRNAVETVGNKAYPKYKLLQNVKNDIKELQEEYLSSYCCNFFFWVNFFMKLFKHVKQAF